MKISFFTTILFFSVFILQAQIVNIPDANFKDALINDLTVDTGLPPGPDSYADLNNDGEIQVSEAEAITVGLYVNNREIASLEGIEFFSNLLTLDCTGNNLVNLDVSQNINLDVLLCYNNQLENLNFSKNNLITLDCGYNNLTHLDLSNSNIFYVWSEYNNLTQIDTDGALNLNFLQCNANNINSLNLSSNPNLDLLNCWGNQLTELDLSYNSILTRISCRNNNLSSLNIKNGNNENFEYMWAYDNPNLTCIQVDDEDYANIQSCNEFDGWCKDDWALYSENCALGVSDFKLYNLKIYPNPVQNTLFINSEFPITNIKIYTLQGQLINETGNNQIDVSLLTSGLYFVSVLIDGENIVKKFIKK